MKKTKTIVAMLLTLALLLASVPVSVSAASEGEGWTLLIFLCGSDLESEGGCATDDLIEMLDADYNDDINVVIATGGAAEWNNEMMDASVIEHYAISSGEIEYIDTQSEDSMGHRETLEEFLTWGAENYMSEHMGLILWNHGGGSISGVCFDERDEDDSLSLKEIEYALDNTSAYYPNGFEFIGFDACLMATLETANVLAPYANYMYASEESEPGTGWDYTALLTYLAENPGADGLELGKVQCESYYNESQEDGSESEATFSVVDLSKMDELNAAFDAAAKEIYESEDFTSIIRAVIGSDNFGGNNKSEGYTNMVDLGDMLSNVSAYVPSADAAISALEEAVVAKINGSQHKNAGGLSVYYPLSIQGTEEISIFTDLCKSTYYLAIVDRLAEGADLSQSGQTTVSGGGSTSLEIIDVYLDDEGIYTVELADMDTFAYASCSLIMEDGEGGYVYLGEDDDVIIYMEDNVITDNFDGTWLTIEDNFLPIEVVSQNDEVSVYTCSVILNDEETYLRIEYDWDSEEFSIIGTWDGINSENSMAGRINGAITEGDVINFIYYWFDEDGNEDYYISDDIIYSEDLEIYYSDLWEGDYDYCINVYDIYGNSETLDFATFTVDEYGDTYYYE